VHKQDLTQFDEWIRRGHEGQKHRNMNLHAVQQVDFSTSLFVNVRRRV
jgi:hypothetical protein